ncbi:MAG: hypothetical protein MZV49_08335 [Rhodopseudomonas palustris]|nr:hypothetical protein [Rhodopseudomonas palustris]
MKQVLDDIQNGSFTRDWMLENKVSQTSLQGHPPPSWRSTRSRKSAPSCAR